MSPSAPGADALAEHDPRTLRRRPHRAHGAHVPRPAPPGDRTGRTGRGPAGPAGAPARAVRVLLCEDQELYRAGLRALLDGEDDLAVVGETDDARTAAGLAARLGAAVVVVRQGLVAGDGGLLEQLCRGDASVLVLAESDAPSDLARATGAGARGYLPRRSPGRRLVDGVRSLARAELVLAPAAGAGAGGTVLDRLTRRQRAVALLVAEGLANEEIAQRLSVSQATVKSHLTAVLRELDLRSRTQLAVLVSRERTSEP